MTESLPGESFSRSFSAKRPREDARHHQAEIVPAYLTALFYLFVS
jgi:hypothetical protein